jgi:hypothetical protein
MLGLLPDAQHVHAIPTRKRKKLRGSHQLEKLNLPVSLSVLIFTSITLLQS